MYRKYLWRTFRCRIETLALKKAAWRKHSCGQDVACDRAETATGEFDIQITKRSAERWATETFSVWMTTNAPELHMQCYKGNWCGLVEITNGNMLNNQPVVAIEGESSLRCGRSTALEIVDAAFVDYNEAKWPCGIGRQSIHFFSEHK